MARPIGVVNTELVVDLMKGIYCLIFLNVNIIYCLIFLNVNTELVVDLMKGIYCLIFLNVNIRRTNMGHISHAIYTCLKYWSIIALSVLAFFSCFSLRCFSRTECFLGAKQIFHNPVKTLFSMLPFSLAGVAGYLCPIFGGRLLGNGWQLTMSIEANELCKMRDLQESLKFLQCEFIPRIKSYSPLMLTNLLQPG